MNACRHNKLVLLPENHTRLRCLHCHLTIRADALDDGNCPECLAVRGEKRNDFETIHTPAITRYRCEECGAIIDYVPRRN